MTIFFLAIYIYISVIRSTYIIKARIFANLIRMILISVTFHATIITRMIFDVLFFFFLMRNIKNFKL